MEFFHLKCTLDSEFFRGGCLGTNVFCHITFGVTNFSDIFHLLSSLDSEFFTRGVWPNFFWPHYIWVQNFFGIFHLQSTGLWIFLRGRDCLGTNFFSHCKFEVKNFSEFCHLPSILDSEFVKVLDTNIFWSHQIWDQKVFRIFSFTKHSGLWIFQGEDWSRHQPFLVMWNVRSKIFQNFLFTECSRLWNFQGGSGNQLFLVTPNLGWKVLRTFSFTKCPGL